MLRIFDANVLLRNGSAKRFNLEIQNPSIHTILSADSNTLEKLLQFFINEKKDRTGKILLNGKNLYDFKERNIISFILKDTSLFKKISIGENIAVGQKKSYFLRKKYFFKKYQKILKEFGSSISMEYRVDELSAEEKRIVELLRAYICKPKILVVEDIINRTDEENTNIMLKIMQELKTDGTIILYLTNSWEDAICISDLITVITGGENVATLTLQEVKQDPARLYYLMNSGKDMQNRIQDMRDMFDSIQNGISQIGERQDFYCSIQQIAVKISRDLCAESCHIHLFSQNSNLIPNVFTGSYKEPTDMINSNTYRVSDDILKKFSKRKEHQVFDIYDANYKKLFSEGARPKSVLFFPMHQKQSDVGILQVNFDRLYNVEQTDILYLSVLCKEILFIIERSKLQEESFLIQESHHRIKNNLQLIISLLKMQENTLVDKMASETDGQQVVKEILDNTVGRVNSISLIHDFLSKNTLINSLVGFEEVLREFQKLYKDQAEIYYDVSELYISHEKASSVALLLNELIINSIKHAHNKHLAIKLRIIRNDTECILKYKDNGNGFPENFEIENQSRMGMLLIYSIVCFDLKGSMKCYNDDGACIDILIEKGVIW